MKKYLAFFITLSLSGCSYRSYYQPIPSPVPLQDFDIRVPEPRPTPFLSFKNNFIVKVIDENNNPVKDVTVRNTEQNPFLKYCEQKNINNDGSYILDNCPIESEYYQLTASKDNWTFSRNINFREINTEQIKDVSVNFYKPSGRIIYTLLDKDNISEIYIINSDGSNRIKLSADKINSIKPVLSPDKKKIAYITQTSTGNTLFTINLDGTDIRKIYNNVRDSWISWSPDGKRILFDAISSNSKESLISFINEDGTELKNITELSDNSFSPALSPDGKKITYVMEEDSESNLCLMNADGSEKKILNNNAGYGYFNYPQLSPDNKKILYLDVNNRAIIINTEGKIKNNPLANSISGVPKWSKNGSRIIFAQYGDNKDRSNIAITSLDGTGSLLYINDLAFNSFPSWSSDEKTVNYISDINGKKSFKIVNDDFYLNNQFFSVSEPDNNYSSALWVD